MTSVQGEYLPDTFRHIALGDVGSTNTACFEHAREGDPGRLWITARRQLGGRGRRGRTWISEPGNLYASLLLINPAPPAALASLPLVVALALHRAIAAEMPFVGDRLRIKWPNDVLIDGRKVSGILIEAETLPDGRSAVVIGCGVNIAHMPENPLYPATSLSEAGASTSPDAIFARLLVELAHALEVWQAGEGLDSIVSSWKALVHGVGQPITVNLPDRSLSGIFAGVERDGLLTLRLDTGDTLRIASGDVFFLRTE
jgi:BirA family biotin operon repressor/biotin-[acetyl-CoA-carboxylase] ligase